MVLKSGGVLSRGVLMAAAALSVVAFGLGPQDGLHPLALMASLLPLQLAALFWAFRGVGSPGSGSQPRANG